jgi:hypothetical protein
MCGHGVMGALERRGETVRVRELVGSKIGPKSVPVAVSDLFFVVGSGQGHWTGQGFNKFIVPARTPSDGMARRP